MRHLRRDNHIYLLDPAGTPAITFGSGEELIVVVPDRGFLEAEFPQGYPTVMTFEDGQVILPGGIHLPPGPFDGFRRHNAHVSSADGL